MLKELENRQPPSDLLNFLSTEIRYGFVKRSNGEILAKPGTEEWKNCWSEEYFLQKPEELLRSKYGVCWDYVELERDWFQSVGYKVKTFYMAVVKKGGSKLPTHTFLAFQDQNKWYWFEYSWYDQRGIRVYNTLDELIADANNRHIESLKSEGATAEDMQNHRLYEYKNVVFGAKPIEFVLSIIKNNQPII